MARFVHLLPFPAKNIQSQRQKKKKKKTLFVEQD